MDSDDVVLVSHWQSLARHKINVSCGCTLLEFRKRVYSAFDEITEKNFKLYTLPIRSLDIKDRNTINDEENFQSILQSLLKMVSEASPPPALYVSSDEKNNND